jgi:hypothetical protein
MYMNNYTCIYKYIHTYMFITMDAYVYISAQVHMYILVCVHTCIRMSMPEYINDTFANVWSHTHMCVSM